MTEPRLIFPKGRVARVLGLVLVLSIPVAAFFAGNYLGQLNPRSPVIVTHEIEPIAPTSEENVPEISGSMLQRVEYAPTAESELRAVGNPGILRYFKELDELERWLENTEIPGNEPASREADQYITNYDCDDYALMLQEKALQDGYMMSFEIIHSGEYRDLFQRGQIPDDTIHAVNLVIIGNEVYYIEPVNHEIVLVACLD